MKRRFATKLILSGAAFAVSAATLVSTTYAWYVQNSQVTATGLTGAVEDKDTTSIFISKDYQTAENPTWTSAVAFENSDFGETKPNKANTLDPIKLTDNAARTFVFASNETTKTVNAVAVNTAQRRYVFSLYLKSNTDIAKILPVIRIKNKTPEAALAGQTAYRAIKDTDSNDLVTKGSAFWTDAVQALRVSVKSEAESNTSTHEFTGGTFKNYEATNIARNLEKGNSDVTYGRYTVHKPTITNTTVFDESQLGTETLLTKSLVGAHAYYAGLVGAETTAGFNPVANTIEDETEIDTIALTANVVTKVTFEIWLDGTDASCFDVCEKQSYEIAVDFRTNAYITFNSNEGSDVEAMTIPVGSVATEPDEPTRAGYNFGGWYKDAKLTQAVTWSDPVNGDLVLYAKWTTA